MLASAPPHAGGVELAQMSIEQRVIIRVPTARPQIRSVPAPPPVEWKEKKGPKCIALRSIRAATVSGRTSIDLLLSDNKRYRARMERSCQAADFWSGFYVEPDKDGSLCSGRDVLLARTGMECEIDSFRKLVSDDD